MRRLDGYRLPSPHLKASSLPKSEINGKRPIMTSQRCKDCLERTMNRDIPSESSLLFISAYPASAEEAAQARTVIRRNAGQHSQYTRRLSRADGSDPQRSHSGRSKKSAVSKRKADQSDVTLKRPALPHSSSSTSSSRSSGTWSVQSLTSTNSTPTIEPEGFPWPPFTDPESISAQNRVYDRPSTFTKPPSTSGEDELVAHTDEIDAIDAFIARALTDESPQRLDNDGRLLQHFYNESHIPSLTPHCMDDDQLRSHPVEWCDLQPVQASEQLHTMHTFTAPDFQQDTDVWPSRPFPNINAIQSHSRASSAAALTGASPPNLHLRSYRTRSTTLFEDSVATHAHVGETGTM